MEVLKPIEGYEDYEISNYGYVWSLNYRRLGIKEKLTGQTDKDGYKTVLINKKGVRKVLKVHRLVAKAFIPNPENKPQVNHKNGNKENNNYTNLEWVTGSENVLHNFHTLGRVNVRGSEHKNSKLTEAQVIEIYRLKGTHKSRDMIKKYGISQQNISRIHTQKSWKWLTDTLT